MQKWEQNCIFALIINNITDATSDYIKCKVKKLLKQINNQHINFIIFQYYPRQKYKDLYHKGFDRIDFCKLFIHQLFILILILYCYNFIYSNLMLKELLNQNAKPNYICPEFPDHHFQCTCSLCNTHEQLKISSLIKLRNSQLKMRVQQKVVNYNKKIQKNSDLEWIIKKLLLPNNKIVLRGIQVFIPQVCFYKHGQPSSLFMNKQIHDYSLKELNKEKLSLNNYILKLFNDRRKKYRQHIETLYKKPKKERVNKPSYLLKEKNKTDLKDAVILKYINGNERLMIQTEFTELMSTRKQDPIWKNILFIKNYILFKDEGREIVVIKYQFDREIVESFNKRLEKLLKVYGKNILEGDKDYISETDQLEFTNSLKKQLDLKEYFRYMSYKIVHFVKVFHDITIKKAHFHWGMDQLRRPILLNLYRLQFQNQLKYDWTNQIIAKKIDENEKKVFYSKQIPEMTQGMVQTARKIQNEMHNQYQKLKDYFGLSMKVKQNVQQIRNNQFFKKLHPECNVQFSKIFHTGVNVNQFKSLYLGYKNVKKPLVSQFKSGMIRILHNMSPRKIRHRYYQKNENYSQRVKLSQSLILKNGSKSQRKNSTRGSNNRTTTMRYQSVNKVMDYDL